VPGNPLGPEKLDLLGELISILFICADCGLDDDTVVAVGVGVDAGTLPFAGKGPRAGSGIVTFPLFVLFGSLVSEPIPCPLMSV
jgi:hypothetical protein